MEAVREEKCEFVPFMTPKKINVTSGKIRSIEFTKTEQDPDTHEWFEDNEQGLTLKCEWVISAFGSTLIDENGKFLLNFQSYIHLFSQKRTCSCKTQSMGIT
jgi:dihydropyrimidine dehydrogenase (NADP+)